MRPKEDNMHADATEGEQREAEIRAYGALCFARVLYTSNNRHRAAIAQQSAERAARGESTASDLVAFEQFVETIRRPTRAVAPKPSPSDTLRSSPPIAPVAAHEGDAECSDCGRAYWSGTGHPTIPLCRACWKPRPKP